MKKGCAANKSLLIMLMSSAVLMMPVSSLATDIISSGDVSTNPNNQQTTTQTYKHASSTGIVVPSTTSTTKKVTEKKSGLLTGTPSPQQISSEKYANMGPGGAPTPMCPRYFGCPDINDRVVSNNTLSKMDTDAKTLKCPDFCIAQRQGDLSGTVMAVCPAGYAQIGMFNAQQEWVRNAEGSVIYTTVDVIDKQNPTSFATFMSYWNDPARYDCHPYTGEGSEPIVSLSELPSKYVQSVCVSWAGVKDCGPFCNDVPWKQNAAGEWSYVAPSGFSNTPQWNSYLPLLNLKTEAPNSPFITTGIDEQTFGLSGIFSQIRAKGRMPVTWCGQSNQRIKPVPICATKSSGGDIIYYEKYPVASYSYTVSPPDPAKTTIAGHDQMITYVDPACTKVAMKNTVCGIPLTYPGEEPDVPASAPEGSCRNLYFKVLIPVYEMTCQRRSGTLKVSPAGYDTPISILCGRVKPKWH